MSVCGVLFGWLPNLFRETVKYLTAINHKALLGFKWLNFLLIYISFQQGIISALQTPVISLSLAYTHTHTHLGQWEVCVIVYYLRNVP